MKKTQKFIVLLLAYFVMSCFNEKTFLSDHLKDINPYVDDQVLKFISSDGDTATLKVVAVQDGRFPDALGAFQNERLSVSAYRTSRSDTNGTTERIITIFAPSDKYEERIEFSISLPDAYLNIDFVTVKDYESKKAVKFKTNFASYDDVLIFDNYPRRKVYDKEIVRFYWSKTSGYVRLILKDGTVWDLAA